MPSTSSWQHLLRREVFALLWVILIADVVVGYLLPVFPLRAQEIGAPLLLAFPRALAARNAPAAWQPTAIQEQS